MLLDLEGVTKHYGTFTALDDITASVRPGVIGLLGPNGAGKSTLIKVLLGLVRLSQGKARVLGHDTRDATRAIRQVVGYMPEDDCVLAGMSAVEAVAYAGELARLPRLDALRRAHEILDYVGIDEERYRAVESYSTGMRQKMRMAQALVHSPKLVFLDEPTSGMDPRGRERMLRLVRELYHVKDIAVVISTHILTDVERCCDSVLILGRGKLLVYDDLETLRRPVDASAQVTVDGDREAFARALSERGLASEALAPDELRVPGDSEQISPAVFAAASASGATVRRLARSQNSLETIFLEAVKASAAPRAGAEPDKRRGGLLARARGNAKEPS
jgi:ABC-2 type transport system ATP-binding protein